MNWVTAVFSLYSRILTATALQFMLIQIHVIVIDQTTFDVKVIIYFVYKINLLVYLAT